VTPPIAPTVAPVPVARVAEPEPPAPLFAAPPAAPQIPESSHFGARPEAGTPTAPAAGPTGGPNAGLFASLPRREQAPAVEPIVPSESPAEYEQRMLRERSAIASEALSELSRLSGYQPAAVESRNSESLARRTPQSTPGVTPTPTSAAEVPHRERNATDVRSMLSGFRAGVERGRADQGRGSEG
jgi:hypothetical protein